MEHLFWGLLIAAVMAVALLELRTHFWLPALAQALRGRGEREKARTLLEQVVRAPSFFRGGSKATARFQIAWLEMEQGRFGEAAEQCRAILDLPLRAGFAALVRYRLADCLEALGRPEEAARERSEAASSLRQAPHDAGAHLARAREWVRKGRLEEACAEYETALKLLPRWNQQGRAEVLIWLALAHQQAGQPGEAIGRAEAAIELDPSPEVLMTAHSAAGMGYAALGKLDEAEAHRRSAFDLAQEAGNEDRAASYLASIASVQRSRGRLLEAMESADRSASMSLKARRHARLVEAECLISMGRLETARTCLEQARAARAHPQPQEERRSQATLALVQGALEFEGGDAEAALDWLRQAADLRDEPRLALWHDCATAPVLAALGRGDEARALVAGIEARAPAFGGDPATQQRCWAGIGRTLLILGDAAGARTAWLRFLATPPLPVDRPTGYYFMGESERLLGNEEAAQQSYRSGGNLRIETHYARRCRRSVES